VNAADTAASTALTCLPRTVRFGVKHGGWRERLLESTRGRILQQLRAREQTVNELAATLKLTDNAVRAHLLSLERDGLVQQTGIQPGFRKPHALYGLTSQSEQIFPKAYGALLELVLSVFERKVAPAELDAGMREVGRHVAALHAGKVKEKPWDQRIEAALAILQELGGSATFEESEGKHFIRGNGCPMAAATARHPAACLIAESLLTELIGVPVKERCRPNGAPSCLFEIGVSKARP
jgi:predicted ArsR family transcriptional regulator